MQIEARGFPEVTRSTKKMIKIENMYAKISRTFLLIVSNRFCFKLQENVPGQWGKPQILTQKREGHISPGKEERKNQK